MSAIVQSMKQQVNETPFLKKVFMQPPLFWTVIAAIIFLFAALILAGEDIKETAAVVTGFIGMLLLVVVAYKSSSFGYYGHCSRMMKQFNKLP